MRLGIENIVSTEDTNLLGAHGLRFRSNPPLLIINDPADALVCQQVGFGEFVADDGGRVVNGEFSEALIAVTEQRFIHVTMSGTVGGAPISAEKIGNIFVVDVPLNEIQTISVNLAKSMLRKAKPTTMGVATSHFGVQIEPVVDLTTGTATRADDPWAIAQNLADASMIAIGIPESERGQLHASNWNSEPTAYSFELESLRTGAAMHLSSEPAKPARASQVQPAPAPAPAPAVSPMPSLLDDDLTIPKNASNVGASQKDWNTAPISLDPPTSGAVHPVLPVYFAVDTDLLARDPSVQALLEGLWMRAADADVDPLQLALLSMNPQPTLETPLSHPTANGGTLTPVEVPPNHRESSMFLADLLDHDMTWFKSESIPILRPVVLMVTASGEAIPSADHCQLTNPGWAYRPNLIVIGANPRVESAISSIPVSFSAVATSATSPNDAITSAWEAIENSAQSIIDGKPAALRFPEAVPGFAIRTS